MFESKILEYLKEHGSTNSFRLARELDIDRGQLLDILNHLEEKQALKFERGNAILSEFPPKKALIKKTPAIKKKIKEPKAPKLFQTENKQLKEKLIELEETIKKLEQKPPKIITKKIIQKVPVEKIVTRTIVKKIPVTKIVIKKVPVREKKKLKIKFKKFKFPKLRLFENIKKLKKPEFVK